MAEHPINGLMDITMDKIKKMVDSDTIIGKPIQAAEGITIIPISKVSFGFASGGSDLPTQKEAFGGGAGAGVTLQPIGFLVIAKGDVRLIELASPGNTAEKVVNSVPGIIDKISGMIGKKEKETDPEKA